jgi:hypothetical protein
MSQRYAVSSTGSFTRRPAYEKGHGVYPKFAGKENDMSCDNDKRLVKCDAPRGLDRLERRVAQLRGSDPSLPPLPRYPEEFDSWFSEAIKRRRVKSLARTETARAHLVRQRNEHYDQILAEMEKENEVRQRQALYPLEGQLRVDRLVRQGELEKEEHETALARMRRDAEVHRFETVKARAEALRIRKDTELYVHQRDQEMDELLFPRIKEKSQHQQGNGHGSTVKRRLAALVRLRREYARMAAKASEEDRAFLTRELRKEQDQIKAGGTF